MRVDGVLCACFSRRGNEGQKRRRTESELARLKLHNIVNIVCHQCHGTRVQFNHSHLSLTLELQVHCNLRLGKCQLRRRRPCLILAGHVEYYTHPMIGRVLVYYKIHSKNNLSKVVKWGGGPSSTCGGGVVIGSGEGSAGVVGQAVVDKRW